MRSRIASSAYVLTPLQSLLVRRWRPQWICHNCTRSSLVRTLATTTTSPESTQSTQSTQPPSANADKKPYYVTTPIFYVNGAPHIGHMYSMILADVLKRWQLLQGRKAILSTGTDEHGMKIQEAAAKAGVPPKEFCDGGAEVFKQLSEQINISKDHFIRTTDQRHREGVEYAWQILNQEGLIYEDEHKGWYSVSDETFYPKSQVELVVDPRSGRKMMASIETGKEVEWTSEKNYHFRLSRFQGRLLQFYEKNPGFIVPKTRYDEVVREVRKGLDDLSVSRPSERLRWGIPVPTDDSQTIYVWLDALLNYATAVGYPFTPGAESEGGFPADVHVIGKDIVRFHCIYWPAFLMALDLPLPKTVLTHAHWTMGNRKMAKSTGNVVRPAFALERFGVDGMRFFLIHDGGIDDDASYTNSTIIHKYQKGLSGGLGNLFGRVMKGNFVDPRKAVERFADLPDSIPPPLLIEGSVGLTFLDELRLLSEKVDAQMKALAPNKALQTIMKFVTHGNRLMQEEEPWAVHKALRAMKAGLEVEEKYRSFSPEKLQTSIYRTTFLAAETVRICSILLQPFIPDSASRLLDMLYVAKDHRSWQYCEVGKDNAYGTVSANVKGRLGGIVFPQLTFSS